MRILKEKYDGLEEVNTIPEQLKAFLSNPNNQELFKDNDFKTLYSRLDYSSPDLTKLLNSLDIDPLKYLDHIPRWFLAYTEIKSINIPDNIKGISGNAFNGCTSLTRITIPSNVTGIGESAFLDCSSLTGVTIPDSVTSIGCDAFSFCEKLKEITYTGMKADWNKIKKHPAWNSASAIQTIHCIDGDIEL